MTTNTYPKVNREQKERAALKLAKLARTYERFARAEERLGDADQARFYRADKRSALTVARQICRVDGLKEARRTLRRLDTCVGEEICEAVGKRFALVLGYEVL